MGAVELQHAEGLVLQVSKRLLPLDALGGHVLDGDRRQWDLLKIKMKKMLFLFQ